MNIENKQSSPLVIASILIIAVLVYIKGVFRIFHNWDELISVIPAFLTTGICLGLFFSLLPLKRPLRSTFFCAAAVPLVSSLIYRSIFIAMANAGVGGGDGREESRESTNAKRERAEGKSGERERVEASTTNGRRRVKRPQLWRFR